MVAAPLDPLHRLYRRREQEGSSRMGAVVRLLVPMCGDGIVAEEGLLPGEPLPASVSTRGHAKKTDLNTCLLMCMCGCCWLLLLCTSAWCAPAVLCSHHHIHDK
uniref:Uncharacterized protein n=1 Tax=Triticum urartu TaxID=4572 RepID=A0A8R7PVH3_TRIUA